MQYAGEEFSRLMSQMYEVSREPKKPQLDEEVNRFVRKARDSALLAVDLYNRPATGFRSEGFIALITVAWTALFHAVFCREKVDFRLRDKKGRIRTGANGTPKLWGVFECIEHYYGDGESPVKANLDFLRRLRNEIVHNHPLDLDPLIVGECQASLFNFEQLLVEKFGEYYALGNYLAVPLQTSGPVSGLQRAPDQRHGVVRFIDDYRCGLKSKIATDARYCLQFWVVPKLHETPSFDTPPIEVVKYDPEDPVSMERVKGLNRSITLIREVRIPVANEGLLRPGKVAERVAKHLGRPFTVYHHTCAWKYYGARDGRQPGGCKPEFCVRDSAHDCYLYTEKWVEFLCEALQVPEIYDQVIRHKWQRSSSVK